MGAVRVEGSSVPVVAWCTEFCLAKAHLLLLYFTTLTTFIFGVRHGWYKAGGISWGPCCRWTNPSFQPTIADSLARSIRPGSSSSLESYIKNGWLVPGMTSSTTFCGNAPSFWIVRFSESFWASNAATFSWALPTAEATICWANSWVVVALLLTCPITRNASGRAA